MKRIALTLLLTFVVMGSGIAQAQANAVPARPIRVIAPFPPGSAGDIIPRAIAPEAGAALKQNMIIDNRHGGASIRRVVSRHDRHQDGACVVQGRD